MRRWGVTGSAFLLFAMFAVAGAPASVVAVEQVPSKIVNYETLFGSLDPDGSLKSVRLVNQLRVFGDGDFVILNPTSTGDFRNIAGTGDARLRDGAIEWTVQGVQGSQEIVSATTPDVPSPLEMGVTYYLDGEAVEGNELVGRSGSVEMVFDVRNTTAVASDVTYEDGSGTEITVQELVPVPMVAELTLTLPKGTFTRVEAEGADVVTAPTGDLTVRWSMVLIPPIGDVAQTFKLHAMTDGFELGRVQLAGAPVAPKSRPFLAYAEDELGAGAESASGLYGGSGTVASNIDRLHDGALSLVDGMKQLFDGSKELNEGLLEAASGSGRLTSGLGEASVGSGTLTAGIGTARDGSARLTAGLGDALDGSSQITGGLRSLRSGMRRILRGMRTLGEGLPAAQAGAQQIALAAQTLDGALATLRAGLQDAQAGAGQIQAGGAGIQAIAAGLAAGAGDIGTGAAGIGTIAGNVGPPLQAAAALCDLDPDCVAIQTAMLTAHACLVGGPAACGGNPDIATIAGAIGAGAASIQTCLTGGGANDCGAGVPSVSTIAGQIAGGAGLIVAGLGNAIAGIGLSTDGATASIRGGVNAIRLGALQLAAGLGDAIAGIGDATTDGTLVGGMTQAVAGADLLTAGSATLTSGLGDAHEGSGRLTAGLGEAHAGSGRLSAGLREAADGSGRLTAGLNRAADGSGRLKDGIGEAGAGAQQIEQNLYLVNEVGVKEIQRAASAKVGEINRQLELLKAQDERAEGESLLYGPPSSDQAETVVGGSSVVLTLDALDGREAASTTRGVATGIGFVVLAGLFLALRGLRRRPAPAV